MVFPYLAHCQLKVHVMQYRDSFDYQLKQLELLLTMTQFHLSDANFGQIDQHIVIAQTWVKLKKTKGYDFKIHNTNFAKLQKSRVFKIVDILLEGDILSNLKFAVQDINEKILENMKFGVEIECCIDKRKLIHEGILIDDNYIQSILNESCGLYFIYLRDVLQSNVNENRH